MEEHPLEFVVQDFGPLHLYQVETRKCERSKWSNTPRFGRFIEDDQYFEMPN